MQLVLQSRDSSRHLLLKHPFPGEHKLWGSHACTGRRWELCTPIAPSWGTPSWIDGLAVVPVILTTLRAALSRMSEAAFPQVSCLGSVSNDGLLGGDTRGLCVLSVSFLLQSHSHLCSHGIYDLLI